MKPRSIATVFVTALLGTVAGIPDGTAACTGSSFGAHLRGDDNVDEIVPPATLALRSRRGGRWHAH